MELATKRKWPAPVFNSVKEEASKAAGETNKFKMSVSKNSFLLLSFDFTKI